MAQFIVKYCDRCNQPITGGDDSILDFLADEYPDRDICQECDLEIQLHRGAAEHSAINNQSLKDSIARMGQNYGLEAKKPK